MELGIAMAWREFVCELCGREYSCMTGDLIIPPGTVCADCFEEPGGCVQENFLRLPGRSVLEAATKIGRKGVGPMGKEISPKLHPWADCKLR